MTLLPAPERPRMFSSDDVDKDIVLRRQQWADETTWRICTMALKWLHYQSGACICCGRKKGL